MARLELAGITKRFGSTEVIRGVDLDIPHGDFCVFVGPSGCGKSTLLRMISGLEGLSGGDIRIDGEVVNDVPAANRGLAMVFQSYALYPHMSVRQNLSFGLENLGTPRADIDLKVAETATMLQIEPLLDRRPRELSGGQRQRVAIGRAVVREPRVFLFDEPLSNLDAELRVEMRGEISRLHRRLGNTMIYVTHDQVEAMTMADRVVVMNRCGPKGVANKPGQLGGLNAVATHVANHNASVVGWRPCDDRHHGGRVSAGSGRSHPYSLGTGSPRGTVSSDTVVQTYTRSFLSHEATSTGGMGCAI